MTNRIWHDSRAALTFTVLALAALSGLAALVATHQAGTSTALAATKHRAPRPAITVAAARSTRLHETILVTPGGGRTLYHLKPESAHHIMCTGACAKLWPPLLVRSRHTRLRAGAGVRGHLSIVRRPGGKLQVAFNGMPLYTFARGHRRGDVKGQGFLHVWFVLPARHTTMRSSSPGAGTTPSPAPVPSMGTPAPVTGY